MLFLPRPSVLRLICWVALLRKPHLSYECTRHLAAMLRMPQALGTGGKKTVGYKRCWENKKMKLGVCLVNYSTWSENWHCHEIIAEDKPLAISRHQQKTVQTTPTSTYCQSYDNQIHHPYHTSHLTPYLPNLPGPHQARPPQGRKAAECPDAEGLTPLQMAATQGSGRMAAVLAAAGLQATGLGWGGHPPFKKNQ